MKDLDQELNDHLKGWFGRRYEEGVNDCALFIAEWVDRVSGSAFAEKYYGRYKSHFEGLRRFARTGVNDAVKAELLTAGWKEVPIEEEFAVGDVILTEFGPGIWRNKSAVCCPPPPMSGTLYLHRRHVKGGLRWQ